MISGGGGMGGGDSAGIDVDIDLGSPSLPSNFGSYGYGGGGYNIMDFGGDFTRSAINAGFSPGNFGLPGSSSDYSPGGMYSPTGIASLPGGFETTGEAGTIDGVDAVIATAKAVDPIAAMLRNYGSNISFTPDMQTPDMSTFVNPGDQPTYMSAAVDSVKGFLGRLAQVHPATRNAAFAMGFVKNLREAENPQEFVKGVLGQLAMKKVGGSLGLSGMQKQGIGGLMNMAQGKQNLAQTVGGLANSAVFRAAAPNILRSVYKDHGMNGVYLALTALGMGKEAAGKGIYGALATPSGPGGGG